MNDEIITLNDSNTIAKLRFNYPQQVIFHAECDDEGELSVGIAYGKEVICMCCGAVVPLDEVDFLKYNPEMWCSVDYELMDNLQREFDME